MLGNVFEKLINSCLKHYGLCPSHYLSAAALSCNAMLNMTKVELEIISDADIVFVSWKGYEKISFLRDIVFRNF